MSLDRWHVYYYSYCQSLSFLERFGIQDLSKTIEEAGFDNIQLLDESFLTIGFLCANKPDDK